MKNLITTCFFFLILLFQISFLQAQTWDWGKEPNNEEHGGGSGYSGNITVDKNGNAYYASECEDVVVLGSDTLLVSNGLSANCFLVKYDSSGNVIWATQPRQGLRDPYSGGVGMTVHSDNSENIYLTGYFSDSIYFGSFGFYGLAYPMHTAFLTKYDAVGNVLWAINETAYYDGLPYSLTTDKSNNVFLMGDCAGSGFSNEYFIIKYNKNGSQLWAKNTTWALPTTSGTSGYCVTTDKAGNCCITGYLRKGSVAFGNDTLTSAYTNNAFLVKYDSSGNIKWAREPIIKAGSDASNASSVGRSVTTDNSGNIYIAGVFYDTLVFGSYTLIAPPGGDSNRMFLVKYDTYGNVLWAKSSSIGYISLASSLTSDSLNHIYLGGTAYGDIKFENILLRPFNLFTYYDYIIDFDTSGKALCGSLLNNGASNFTSANNAGIASDPSGRYIYLEGADAINDTLIAGHDTLVPTISGGYNSYLARWIPCNYLGEGINEVKGGNEKVNVYPDPNNGQFTIQINNGQWIINNEKATIEIYSVLGEKVYSQLSIVNYPLSINLSQPSGIYFYRVLTNDGGLIGEGKLMVQK